MADATSQLTQVLGWIALLATPAVSVGFLIGLVRSRARAARALGKLSGVLGRPSAQELRQVIAEAVDDPSLQIVYRNSGDPAEWVDESGRAVELPERSPDRATTEIRSRGVPVAALLHDAALAEAPVMTEVANGFAQMALQNQRLETELRSSLTELKASRSRIMSAADAERRRIERDLHDGAQQRLLALAIELELAGELVTTDPDKGAKRLHELVEDVNEAMADIRSLASGLYPSLLLERGLVEAVSEVAAACALPTTLTAESLGRYAPEIEGAVYFCCREALQNAAKHAEGARSVAIKLWEAEAVHFEVRDDGAGLPQGHGSEGAGITNMRDRIGAMGGTLAIESHPGAGTRVMGAVPKAPADLPPPIDSLLRRATDALPDCLAIYRAVMDARGNVADFAVEHMNDAARRDLGLGAQELAGQTLGRLQPDYLGSKAFRWLRHIVELEVPGVREDNAYEPIDGGRRRLRQSSELRAAPLGGGRVVVVWRDVTEHARAEEELRLQSTVLRRAAEGVCLIRASDSVIVYTNQRFAEILGYEPGELDGRPVTDINWEDEPRRRRAGGGADRRRSGTHRRGALRPAQPAQGRKPDLVRGARRGLRPSRPRTGLGLCATGRDLREGGPDPFESRQRPRPRLGRQVGALSDRWRDRRLTTLAWRSASCAGETSFIWSAVPTPAMTAGGCFCAAAAVARGMRRSREVTT